MQIAIIGSGNIATQLGLAFIISGHNINYVFSKNDLHKKVLAKKLKCKAAGSINEIQSDVIIIAVNDNAIPKVALQLKGNDAIIAHTSGSVNMNVLKHLKKYGVIYPLQTINKIRKVEFRSVPLCIEGNNKQVEKILLQLASSISGNIYQLNSEQRLHVHLAAVIANNFSNHLFALSESYLKAHNLSFDLLKPLIKTTADNITTTSPALNQTGPAKRNDTKTIKQHLDLLAENPELKAIYKLISASIRKEYNK